MHIISLLIKLFFSLYYFLKIIFAFLLLMDIVIVFDKTISLLDKGSVRLTSIFFKMVFFIFLFNL